MYSCDQSAINCYFKIVMIMALTISCRYCNKQFKTGYSARKHHDGSHAQCPYQRRIFCDLQGRVLVNQPTAKQLQEDELPDYKTWLAILAEQVAGSLIPSSKCETFDCYRGTHNESWLVGGTNKEAIRRSYKPIAFQAFRRSSNRYN